MNFSGRSKFSTRRRKDNRVRSRNPKEMPGDRVEKFRQKMKYKRVDHLGLLNSKSPFYIKNLKFVTPKPQFNVTTKFYKTHINDSSLYQCSGTASGLELKYKKRMHSGVTMDLPIDLIGAGSVKREKRIELNDDDLMLLGQKKKDTDKKRYDISQHSWLRKTEYITQMKQTDSSNRRMDRPGVKLPRKPREEWDVNKSFEQSKSFKPKETNYRKVVGVYNVFPNFDLWENNYVHVQFDRLQGGVSRDVTQPRFSNGILRRDENRKDLFYHERDSNSGLYPFKKKFSVERFHDESYFMELEKGEKNGLYNQMGNNFILKGNPYRGKSLPNPLSLQYRNKNEEEEKFSREMLKEIGVETRIEGEEDEDTLLLLGSPQESVPQNTEQETTDNSGMIVLQ